MAGFRTTAPGSATRNIPAGSPTAAGRTCTAATASGPSPIRPTRITLMPNIRAATSRGSTARRWSARDIQPKAGYKEKLRYNWNTPIALSPNEKGTIYIGSQFLFRSRDHGVTWDRISPDLTTNDPIRQKQEQSGGITVDNSVGRDEHDDLFDLGKPARGRPDLGRNRRRQRPADPRRRPQLDQPHAPISACPRATGSAGSRRAASTRRSPMSTDDRHAYGDMQPYLYRTDRLRPDVAAAGRPGNAGRARLRACDQGRPAQPQHPVSRHRIRLVHQRSNGGRSWAQFKPNNFPDGLAVRDIALQERDDDLVLATHGRGIWVIDDISPLRQLTPRDPGEHRRADPGAPGRAADPGQWRLGRGRCHLLRRQSAERRDHHLLPEGAARDRPDEARDPRRQRQGRRRDPGVEAARPQPGRTGRCGPSRRWCRRPRRSPARRPHGERFLPGTYTVRLTNAGQVIDRAADGHARQARDLHARRPPGAVRRVRAGQGHVRADEQGRRADQRRPRSRPARSPRARPRRPTSRPPPRSSAARPTRCARRSSPRPKAARSPARSGCASMSTRSMARSIRSRTGRPPIRWRGSTRSTAS